MLDLVAKKYLLPAQGYPVTLSPHLTQIGSPVAVIDSLQLWVSLSKLKKIKALLIGKWIPSFETLQTEATNLFLLNIFGKENELGTELLKINLERYKVLDEYSFLTNEDVIKISAYEALLALTQRQIEHSNDFDFLSIRLLEYCPRLCFLIYPTIVKTPILSIAKNIIIDFRFTANKIRESKHPQANDLIANLYELLCTQQKISIELLNYTNSFIKSNNAKENSFLNIDNINEIKSADLIIVYLKSSIEKMLNTLACCISINL